LIFGLLFADCSYSLIKASSSSPSDYEELLLKSFPSGKAKPSRLIDSGNSSSTLDFFFSFRKGDLAYKNLS
jgi:hypothetical protein